MEEFQVLSNAFTRLRQHHGQSRRFQRRMKGYQTWMGKRKLGRACRAWYEVSIRKGDVGQDRRIDASEPEIGRSLGPAADSGEPESPPPAMNVSPSARAGPQPLTHTTALALPLYAASHGALKEFHRAPRTPKQSHTTRAAVQNPRTPAEFEARLNHAFGKNGLALLDQHNFNHPIPIVSTHEDVASLIGNVRQLQMQEDAVTDGSTDEKVRLEQDIEALKQKRMQLAAQHGQPVEKIVDDSRMQGQQVTSGVRADRAFGAMATPGSSKYDTTLALARAKNVLQNAPETNRVVERRTVTTSHTQRVHPSSDALKRAQQALDVYSGHRDAHPPTRAPKVAADDVLERARGLLSGLAMHTPRPSPQRPVPMSRPRSTGRRGASASARKPRPKPKAVIQVLPEDGVEARIIQRRKLREQLQAARQPVARSPAQQLQRKQIDVRLAEIESARVERQKTWRADIEKQEKVQAVAAAGSIQAALRGRRVRQSVRQWHHAAIRIQACSRGRRSRAKYASILARKQVGDRVRHEQDAMAVRTSAELARQVQLAMWCSSFCASLYICNYHTKQPWGHA
jgi:hypothetical protein